MPASGGGAGGDAPPTANKPPSAATAANQTLARLEGFLVGVLRVRTPTAGRLGRCGAEAPERPNRPARSPPLGPLGPLTAAPGQCRKAWPAASHACSAADRPFFPPLPRSVWSTSHRERGEKRAISALAPTAALRRANRRAMHWAEYSPMHVTPIATQRRLRLAWVPAPSPHTLSPRTQTRGRAGAHRTRRRGKRGPQLSRRDTRR